MASTSSSVSLAHASRRLLVLAAVFSQLCWPAAALIYRTTLPAGPGPTAIVFSSAPFGFKAGGQITVTLDCNTRNLGTTSLLMLTDLQYERFLDQGSQPCSNIGAQLQTMLFQPSNTSTDPTLNSLNVETTLTVGIDIPADFYVFLLAVCPSSESESQLPGSCQAVLVTLNPGGEHLSSDEIILPTFFRYLALSWGGMLLLWLLNWAYYLQFVNFVHRVLFLGPALKLLSSVMEFRHYELLSENGEVASGYQTAERIFNLTENSIFLYIMLLVARGYGILRPIFTLKRRLRVAFGPFLFFLSQLGSTFLSKYLVAFSVILVPLIAVHVLRDSSLNLVKLKHRLHELALPDRPASIRRRLHTVYQAVAHKLSLIAGARLVFVVFAIGWIVIQITSALVKEKKWIESIVMESLDLFAYLPVLLLFRLRFIAVYNTLQSRRPVEEAPLHVCSLLKSAGQEDIQNIVVVVSPRLSNSFLERLRQEGVRRINAARTSQPASNETQV